jgi:hypothetical protein
MATCDTKTTQWIIPAEERWFKASGMMGLQSFEMLGITPIMSQKTWIFSNTAIRIKCCKMASFKHQTLSSALQLAKKPMKPWNRFRWYCVSRHENYLLISFTITVLSSATWITMELHSSYTASFLKWTHEVQCMTLIQSAPRCRVLL